MSHRGKVQKLVFKKRTTYFSNHDGWILEIRQTYLPKKYDAKRRPLILVPGYGMNSFILGYHPTGLAMEDFFANEGFEVWSANLRGQGGSKKIQGDSHITLKDFGV